MNKTQSRPRPRKPAEAGLLILIAMSYLAASAPASGATCSIPADHSTIQAAVVDPNCDPINLTDQTYAESLLIERSVSIVGPTEVAEIAGLVEVKGSGVMARLTNIKVDNGCSPGALVVSEQGQVEGDSLEVVRTEGGPCPPVFIDLIFADGFESSNTTAWTSTVP